MEELEQKSKAIKTAEFMGDVFKDTGFQDFINRIPLNDQQRERITTSEPLSRKMYVIFQDLKNTPGLEDFINKLPDKEKMWASTFSVFQEKKKLFEQKEAVSNNLINIYKTEIEKDLGLNLSDQDLISIKEAIEEKAINTPELLKIDEENLALYKELPEQINEKIREIYSTRIANKKFYKEQLEGIEAESNFIEKMIPFVGRFLKRDLQKDQQEFEGQLKTDNELETRDTQIERATLEKQLQDLREKLFSEEFLPAQIAHQIAKEKLKEQMGAFASLGEEATEEVEEEEETEENNEPEGEPPSDDGAEENNAGEESGDDSISDLDDLNFDEPADDDDLVAGFEGDNTEDNQAESENNENRDSEAEEDEEETEQTVTETNNDPLIIAEKAQEALKRATAKVDPEKIRPEKIAELEGEGVSVIKGGFDYFADLDDEIVKDKIAEIQKYIENKTKQNIEKTLREIAGENSPETKEKIEAIKQELT